ncbi:MAG: ribosome-associated heat shock protein Hsp15 [Oceanospirillaceae bacterium]|nr:ribosome-associated heat shock protein Hsp15 [Oceanospirillaceae bacterium]
MSKDLKVRLDKWLWAARFFKTRALAKKAIEGGKVHYDGQRSKCSKIVEIGAMLKLRQGWDEPIVEIIALSEKRAGAPQAVLLYSETQASIEKRSNDAQQRKILKITDLTPKGKPDKRSRRQIQKTKDLLLTDQ